LTNQSGLCTKLRMPAQSRLQRVHNVEMALKELRIRAEKPPSAITSRDVVDGHQEKTLDLLWYLLLQFQLAKVLDTNRLREEVAHLEKSLRYR